MNTPVKSQLSSLKPQPPATQGPGWVDRVATQLAGQGFRFVATFGQSPEIIAARHPAWPGGVLAVIPPPPDRLHAVLRDLFEIVGCDHVILVCQESCYNPDRAEMLSGIPSGWRSRVDIIATGVLALLLPEPGQETSAPEGGPISPGAPPMQNAAMRPGHYPGLPGGPSQPLS
jgi:hypothetical protein